MAEVLRRSARCRERGFSLVELLVAMTVFAIVGGMITMGLYVSTRANHVIVPAALRMTVRTRVATELRTAQAGAGKLAYFDAASTVRPLVGSHSGASSGASAGASALAGSTNGTDGKTPGGSGGGGGHVVPVGHTEIDGVYGWGTGVMIAGRRVVGPVAVWPDQLIFGQQGPLVVTLRTEPGVPGFCLGDDFVSSSNRIKLAAHSADDALRITALGAGDLLYVNGVADDGSPATALASVTGAPVQVPAPALESGALTPSYVYYELAVAAPNTTYAWGLSNPPETSGGVTILSDASVALLDRLSPVVTYYTKFGNIGPHGATRG